MGLGFRAGLGSRGFIQLRLQHFRSRIQGLAFCRDTY